MTKERSTIFVIDDDPSARKGLMRLVSAAGLNVEAFSSARDFLDSGKSEEPGCLVLDVQMPEMTGPELHDELRQADYCMPIIFLSAHADVPTTAREMKKGAINFLTKPVDGNDLLEAIHESLLIDQENRLKRAEETAILHDVHALSPREHEVMTYVITGMLNKQIATKLSISLDTVKAHRGQVTHKLGVFSVAELVRLCEKAGIAPAESSDD
jgi:two-component system response regulator FixJ